MLRRNHSSLGKIMTYKLF